MTYLLLGGAGFLGANLTLFMLRNGCNVVIADVNIAHLKARPEFSQVNTWYEVDVTDIDVLMGIIKNHGVTCVVNLSACLLPNSTFDEFSREMYSKIVPGFMLFQHFADNNIKYVYFSSGGAIYGSKGGRCRENDLLEPTNLYGYSKLMVEEYILFASRAYGLEYLIFRPSNPYGPFQSPVRQQGFIAVALHRLISDKGIDIWGNGDVVRDFIYVQDAILAIGTVVLNGNWNNIFNIGSGIGYSLNEVILILESVTGKQANVTYRPSRSTDVGQVVLDISKLQKLIGFQPVSLVSGVAKYYNKLCHYGA